MAFVYNEFDKAAVPWLEVNLQTAWDWFNANVWKFVTDFMKTPSANFVIKYVAKETDKVLNGLEARELSANTHGPMRWWVELEKE